VIKPPVATGVTGQASVTAMAGAVVIGQVAETVFVTRSGVQASLPRALKVVVTVQPLTGAVRLLVKLADAPGASEPAVNTVVLGAGRSLTTTMLLRIVSPRLRTVPLYTSEPPGNTGAVGHAAVTPIWGVVRMGQVALAVLVTGVPQRLAAVAVKVSATEQLAGAV
jgi:hypothetical protein